MDHPQEARGLGRGADLRPGRDPARGGGPRRHGRLRRDRGLGVARALYFTVITITTVGYGDEGISPGGRVFATFLLLGGLGVASHALAQLVQAMANSEQLWRKRMQARIAKLRDHVIVCGFGRMGRAVCAKLRADGTPFVVIDREVEAYEAALDEGFLAIQGGGSDDEVLLTARVTDATYVVSAVDTRQESILITLTARGLAPGVTILARAESAADEEKLRRAGADFVISPLSTGGLRAANLILHPEVSSFLDDATSADADADVTMASVVVGPGSPLVGQRLGDYGRDVAPRVSFVLLRRADRPAQIPPPGTVTLEEGDRLIVAGAPVDVARMRADGLPPAMPSAPRRRAVA